MKMGPGGRGLWLAFLIAGLVVGAAFTYFVLPRRPPRTEINSDVCARTFATVAGINSYLADRAAVDPGSSAHPLVGVPEADRDEVWAEYLETTGSYTAETIAGFNATFAGESQFLVERLSEAGYWSEPAEVVAVNELAVSRLAQELEASAKAAGCQP